MSLWRVRATVDDRPGFLAVLTASLALRSVNILSVHVHATEAGAVDDFLVDAPDSMSEADLLAAVAKGRGRNAWAGRTDAHGLIDTPTQLLGMAGRLVRDPEELAAALSTLLGNAEVSWRPEPCEHRAGFTDQTIVLSDPAGGTLSVRREAPPFTPAEYARAHALTDLATEVTRQAATYCQLLLTDGSEVTLRLAAEEDVDDLRALHDRCSPESRRRRYLSGTVGPTEAQLSRLVRAPHGYTLVALDETGTLIAMANLLWDGSEAELGVLVEDGWQCRGVGTALVRRLVKLASASGIEAVHAHTHADNAPMIRTMRRLGRVLKVTYDGPIATVTAGLRSDLTAETGSPFPARSAGTEA
jgi:RimJ/RimL family protein N-acetyltransferase